MSGADAHTLVRLASVYVTVAVTAGLVLWRRPAPSVWPAVTLAAAWNVPALVALNVVAIDAGWWTFEADGGMWLGMPLDLLLAWAWAWSALPILLAPRAPFAVVLGMAAALDMVLMPLVAPVLRLHATWWRGELLALLLALWPSLLLARWTLERRHLHGRAVLQVVAFAGVTLFLLPTAAVTASGSTWADPRQLPPWALGLWLQALAGPALLGLTAVQEFVVRGRGTPVPFDPPSRLVTTGIYAYLRNPMQTAATVLLILLGLVLRNLAVAAAGLMAFVYSAGLAAWDEGADMRGRHGDTWDAYAQAVPRWWPRWRPWQAPGAPPAVLYVGQSCAMCREVATWFERRDSVGLAFVPAEAHPSARLTRVTYEAPDGHVATGVAAIARALEHLHLGWAVVGAMIRLPGLVWLVQLVADASGAEPRLLPQAQVE